MKKRTCDKWLTDWVLMMLSNFRTSFTRDFLTYELQRACMDHGTQWTRETCSRMLRLAFNELERQGHAIISEGNGFHIARTPEQRALSARRLEKMGLSLLKRASIIRGLTLDGEMKQLSLEDV